MNTDNENEKPIYGIFTPEEVKELHDEYKIQGNPNVALRKIATPIFRRHLLRQWDEGSQEVKEAVQTAFFNVQAVVVTSTKTKTRTVEHMRGDVIRDKDGAPITDGTNADGTPRFKTYPKNTVERIEEVEERPYFNYLESPQALRDLERRLRSMDVLPDFTALREKFLDKSVVDYERGCEAIRNLTKYYVFDDPDRFVERFALLVANAKAKALGIQPKWPVLFSLVGKMGVGKSWLAQMVKETYDAAFECRSGVTSYGRLLDGNFNSMMATRGFLSLDEAQGLDKAQCEKLKTYITSQKVDIERKGVDVQTCDNLVTFFSTTNESVKDVMGYQQDRRIVEFNILEKRGEIPEQDVRRWLDEMWLVMPVEHPTQERIKMELLDDSSLVLDTRMEEIVYEVFNGRCSELLDARNRLNVFKFKRAIRDLGGVPYARVRDWCFDKGLMTKYTDGHIYAKKRDIIDFIDRQRADRSSNGSSVPSDIEEMFSGRETT